MSLDRFPLRPAAVAPLPDVDLAPTRLVGPVMRETIQGEGKLLATRARTFYADFMISGPVAAR